MVRVRVMDEARDCTRCISFLFFCSAISVVNTFVFVGTVSAHDRLLVNHQ